VGVGGCRPIRAEAASLTATETFWASRAARARSFSRSRRPLSSLAPASYGARSAALSPCHASDFSRDASPSFVPEQFTEAHP